MRVAAAILLLGLTGCSLLNRGAIKAGGVSVTGVRDAGKPATLATSNAGTSVPLPEGSVVVVTKVSPIAAKPATKDEPAVKGEPAKEITEIRPAGPTEYHHTESTVKADTGAVDTSVAMKRIDAEESRILLYASIAAAIAAGLFVYIKYPTPAMACGGASIVFFLAWKLSDLPPWFYAVGIALVAGAVTLWHGHEKGLYTPVPDDSTATKPPTK